MELLFIALVMIHSSAIALGVGSSTLAITGFIVALLDGDFDASERRIMGVIYTSLRVAMGMIFVSSLLIMILQPGFFGWFTVPLWVMTAVLFVNAFLMTKHWIPKSLGPAIQAGTWYTLGFVITAYVFDLFELSMLGFAEFYAVDLIIAILIVNGCLRYLQAKRS